MSKAKLMPLPAAEAPSESAVAVGPEPTQLGSLGAFQISMEGDANGGTLSLTPPTGEALHLIIQGDCLKLDFRGPRLEVAAPDAAIAFRGRSIELQGSERIRLESDREVDIHSGVDVEVRADHHVNLWGHGVLVGD
ncbi:MAG: hypothetical protein CMP23_02205 [Rickettsiales bacterium]|nr:hypothetical protein [Rickettsiales bacterium]